MTREECETLILQKLREIKAMPIINNMDKEEI